MTTDINELDADAVEAGETAAEPDAVETDEATGPDPGACRLCGHHGCWATRDEVSACTCWCHATPKLWGPRLRELDSLLGVVFNREQDE
jgi:hypothetical protein